jgi:hypothetical protein
MMPTVPLSRRVAALLFSLALIGAALAGCESGPSQTATATRTATTSAIATPTHVPPTPTGVPAGWTYYQDPMYHFDLEVPASWSISTSTSTSSSAVYYYFQDQGNAPNGDYAMLNVSIEDAAGGDGPWEKQQFCTSPKTTTVAGFPAVVADHDPPVGVASPGAQLVRDFVANGLFYIIQLTGEGELLNQLQQRLGPLFAQILASFKPGPGQPGNLVCMS